MLVAGNGLPKHGSIIGHSRYDQDVGLIACAFTLGFKFAEQTPGVDNVYSLDRRYNPDDPAPGNVKFYLEPVSEAGLKLADVQSAWADWRESFGEIQSFPARLGRCRRPTERQVLAKEFDGLEIAGAIGYMRLFQLSRIKIDAPNTISAEETHAVNKVDGIADRIRGSEDVGAIARDLAAAWPAAMAHWVKAWLVNFRECKEAWKHAGKSLKVSRPDKPMPLVIPEGRFFDKMVNRWT